MVKPLWLQDGPCYWCESGQKLFVGEQGAARLCNMGRQRYTGENAGCGLCTNLRHSPAFIDSLWGLCVSARHQCFFSLASDMLLKQCLSWLFAAYRGSAVQASQLLCFILNLTLISSGLTDGLQDLLRCTLGKPENLWSWIAIHYRLNTVSYSITSVVDTVSIVANKGSQKIRFHVSVPLVTGSKAD